MTRRKVLPLPPQLLKAAADWFVEFHEGNVPAAQRAEFVQWLRASPEHVRAYVQMSAHWEEGRNLGRKDGLTVEQLMELGSSDANSLPLVSERGSLFPPQAAERTSQVPASRSRLSRMLALAASVLVLAGSFWLYDQRNLYDTDIGEQRSITLADGSTIDLNSRSRVRVNFNSAERGIDLLEGQALFTVARDRLRPFVVRSGDTHVRAIGTRFDMYRKTAGTVVTVVEGRVAVINDAKDSLVRDHRANPESAPEGVALTPFAQAEFPAIELAAGEQVTVTPTVIQRPAAVDVGAATAWTQKQIIFRDTPLRDVVEEFNRYNTRKMRVVDSDSQSIRISGAFASTDPASLLRALNTMNVFYIEESSAEVRISRK
jgi:transmembrane sensor